MKNRSQIYADKYVARNSTWLKEVEANIAILKQLVMTPPSYTLITIPPRYHDSPTLQYIGVKIHDIEDPIHEWNLEGFAQNTGKSWYELEQRYSLTLLREATELKLVEYIKAVQRVEPPILKECYYWCEYFQDRERQPMRNDANLIAPTRFTPIEDTLSIVKKSVSDVTQRNTLSTPVQNVSHDVTPTYTYGPGDEFEQRYNLPPKQKKSFISRLFS